MVDDTDCCSSHGDDEDDRVVGGESCREDGTDYTGRDGVDDDGGGVVGGQNGIGNTDDRFVNGNGTGNAGGEENGCSSRCGGGLQRILLSHFGYAGNLKIK